jgi:hypothetical protein
MLFHDFHDFSIEDDRQDDTTATTTMTATWRRLFPIEKLSEQPDRTFAQQSF